LAAAVPFARWAQEVTGVDRNLEDLPATDFPAKNLFVLMTTDKGLCGGVNSIMGRMSRQLFARLDAEKKEYQLLVLGEKGRSALRRNYGAKFIATVTERNMPYHWDLAAAITQETLNAEYDQIHLIYNEFKSAIVYTPSIKSITPHTDPTGDFFLPFEVEPECDHETVANFFEYTLSTQIYHSLMDNCASEQSSRMSAMENASKNASEMIGKLTLQYNRARQTRITTELIEIISGASALKG